MKILAALSRFPWPLEKGDKLRAYYQLKDLSRNHEVHLVCLSENEVSQSDLEKLSFCKSVHVIQLSFFQRMGNLLRALFNDLPFQVNYFRSKAMRAYMDEFIYENEVDITFVQLIRLGLNLPFEVGADIETSWFLDYMDCFSIGMEKRVAKSSWPKSVLVKAEARRLKKFEAKIAASFDEIGIISPRDAAGLPPFLQDYIHIIPNGVGESFFEKVPVLEVEGKRYDLVFFGNMGYQPNVESALFLVEEVLPAAQKLGLELKVCIAGARPAKQVLALSSPNIEVTGFVEDIREYVRASRLAIAPVSGGQGLQNKLLESMALGLPTLTTPEANAAIGAEAGRDIVVCSGASAFALEIKRLLEDKEEAAAIGQRGRAFVDHHFRWSAMNQKLETILVQAAGLEEEE